MSFIFALKGGGAIGWAAAVDMLTDLSVFSNLHLAHLWFLYYLMLLYTAALVLLPLLNRLPNNVLTTVQRTVAPYVVHAKALPVLMLATFLTLLPMAEVGLDTATSWIPAWHVLAAYSVFFAYGWLVYRQRVRLQYFKSHWAICLGLGLALVALLLFVLPAIMPDPVRAVLMGKALAAMTMWLLIFASLGLFLRYFEHASPIIRYLSDASYWMYLIHLPVVLIGVGLLAPFSLPAYLKFCVVLTGTLMVSLFTYYLFVRSTVVGALLNGRKYSRRLPLVVSKPLQTVA